MTVSVTDAEKAYQQILAKIIQAQMEPGSVISEHTLMEELGYGRTPVREALKRLQAELFVITSPRRGMFVAPITYSDINRIYEVRLEMESIGIRLATERITESQLDALDCHISSYPSDNSPGIDSLIELDRKFHFGIYQATHNPLLQTDLQRYYYMSQRIWFYTYEHLAPEYIGLQDHPGILKELRARNPEGAEKKMRKHNKNFQNHIKEYLLS
ncbi:MAG: GntR family transcriptional regulator [Anaerolineales bacterium]|jgi:DNA-binding GntR family transcriptional regulator